MGFNENDHHKLDRNWCLNVLSTLCSDHAIFKKDFLPEKKKQQIQKEGNVSEADYKFFEGLPVMKTKKVKRKTMLKYFIKEDPQNEVKTKE